MKPCSTRTFGTWLLALFAFASAVSLLGCSSGTPGEDTAVESDGLVCGTRTAITAEGDAVEVPAWYYTRAMNAKLRSYPVLAEFAGFNRVTSCAEAAAFKVAYAQYAADHPDFDLDQAYEVRQRPPFPAGPPPVVMEEKISTGTVSRFAPVVKLETTYYGKTWACTGSFIAKNWVMTAAHCLNPGEDKKHIHADNAYYPWAITFSDANGKLGKRLPLNAVLQIAGFDYTGTYGEDDVVVTHPFGGDFALLYIDGSYDVNLPRSDSPGSDFLRLSTAGAAPLSARAWGWGAPAVPSVSKSMPLDAYTALSQSAKDITSLEAIIPSTDPYLCEGDSGGPLVDKYYVNDPVSGQATEVPAVVGTLVGGAKVASTDSCKKKAGGLVIWARVDQNLRFIRRVMRDRSFQGPNFDCNYQSEIGTTGNQVVSCWLKPCLADDECPANARCINSFAADYFPCTDTVKKTCDGTPYKGTCGCIRGKCQPMFDQDALF